MIYKSDHFIKYINALKIIAILGVIILHLSALIPNSLVSSFFVNSFRWSVLVFIFISGATLLSKDETLSIFFNKRCKRIILPLLFWSLLYTILKMIFVANISYEDILLSFLYGVPFYHLWFVYMIIGLYLITPALRTYSRFSSKMEKFITLIVLFLSSIIASIFYTFIIPSGAIVFVLFIPYISYYLCGNYLSLIDLNKYKLSNLIILLIIILILIILRITIFSNKNIMTMGHNVFEDFNPITIAMSIIIYLLFAKSETIFNFKLLKLSNLIDKIAPTTFGIYLLHPIILHLLVKKCNLNLLIDLNLLIFIIPLISTVIFIICYFIVSIINKIPYLKRII